MFFFYYSFNNNILSWKKKIWFQSSDTRKEFKWWQKKAEIQRAFILVFEWTGRFFLLERELLFHNSDEWNTFTLEHVFCRIEHKFPACLWRWSHHSKRSKFNFFIFFFLTEIFFLTIFFQLQFSLLRGFWKLSWDWIALGFSEFQKFGLARCVCSFFF